MSRVISSLVYQLALLLLLALLVSGDELKQSGGARERQLFKTHRRPNQPQRPSCETCPADYSNRTVATSDLCFAVCYKTNCLDFGECYQGWQKVVDPLKELAINCIERAHLIEQTLTREIGLSKTEAGEPKLEIRGNWTNLAVLGEKIESISDRILDNKRNSDLVVLLKDEFAATQQALDAHRDESKTHYSNVERLFERFESLHGRLHASNKQSDGLREKMSAFNWNLTIVQESLPMEAFKEIKLNGQRSRRASLEARGDYLTLSDHNSEFLPKFNLELDHVRYLKRQMDLIGTRILDRILVGRQDQESSEFNSRVLRDMISMLREATSPSDVRQRRQLANDSETLNSSSLEDFYKANELVGGASEVLREFEDRLSNMRLSMSENLILADRLISGDLANRSPSKSSAIDELDGLIGSLRRKQDELIRQALEIAHVSSMENFSPSLDFDLHQEAESLKSSAVALSRDKFIYAYKQVSLEALSKDTDRLIDDAMQVVSRTRAEAADLFDAIRNATSMLVDACGSI